MILPQEEPSTVGLRHPSFTRNDPGLEQANWQTAIVKKRRQCNRHQKGELVPYSIDLEFFKQYGPGTYLFFVFTRKLGVLMLLLALLSIPQVVSNYMGGGLTAVGAGSSKIYFMQFSVANQPLTATNDYLQLHNYLTIIPDAVISLVFFIFLLYWDRRSEQIVEEMKKESQLPSYFTVEISNRELLGDQVQLAMQTFGDLQEVAEVKNYDESISLAKKISETTMQMRLEQLEERPCEEKIKKYQQKLEEYYKQITESLTKSRLSTIKYFVTFKRIADRKQLLQYHLEQTTSGCPCGRTVPENLLVNGQLLMIKACKIQPGSIIWENVHISSASRVFRGIFQWILVILALFVGFLAISLLNILTPQSQTSSVDASNYTYSTVVAANNANITQAWCLLQSPTTIIQSTTLLSLCQSYLLTYYSTIGISVAISVSVIIIKSILKLFLTFLARFQRYESFNQQVSSLIVNLFLTYTFTTFFITFLLKANIYGVSFKTIITNFVTDAYLLSNAASITQFTDFSRAWYADVGYQIVINWLVLSLIPHIFQPILLLLGEAFDECGAKKQRLQRKMEKAIEGKEFTFDDNYANVLMIVFVSVMLCGPIPLLLLIGGLALLTRYLFWKYYFIRFCKITPTFDESLNSKVTGILYWAVIAHLCVSIYAFGNTEIFAVTGSIQLINSLASSLATGSGSIVSTLISRCAVNWLLTSVLAFVIISYVLKTFFVDSIMSLARMCAKDKLPTVLVQNNQEFMAADEKDFVTSYRMDSNPNYEEIVSILRSFGKRVQRQSVMAVPLSPSVHPV